MKYVLNIGILLVITTFPSCFDLTNLTRLPPLTTEGNNTIGCVVNGKTIFNDYKSDVNAYWRPETHELYVTAIFHDESFLEISIRSLEAIPLSRDIDSTSIADWAAFTVINGGGCYYRIGNDTTSRDTTYFGSGIFKLKLDRFDAGIVSGTFSFTLKRNGCPDLIVTDGRFDIKAGGNVKPCFCYKPSSNGFTSSNLLLTDMLSFFLLRNESRADGSLIFSPSVSSTTS